MTADNLKEILILIMDNIESLKAIKLAENYVTVNSDISFKGNNTGKLVTVNVQINEDDSVEITGGDAPFINIVQKMVKDFYNETH